MIIGLLFLALIGSLISAFSDNFALVLLGRAMQGFSVTVLSLGIGLLRESLDSSRLPMSIGFMTTAQGIGGASVNPGESANHGCVNGFYRGVFYGARFKVGGTRPSINQVLQRLADPSLQIVQRTGAGAGSSDFTLFANQRSRVPAEESADGKTVAAK